MEAIAERLGLTRKGRRWGACPRCGATRASRSDERLPLLINNESWNCVACRTGGHSEATFVAWALTGGRVVNEEVRRFLGESGSLAIRERTEPEPPRRIDPSAALKCAKSIRSVSDPRLVSWLTRRCISANAPAGWLPRFSAPWWPWANDFPLVIPACTGTGKVESMHGVSIGDAPRKTTWPVGANSRELLFAAPSVRLWLSGKAPAPRDVIVVEGATDFLTATIEFPDDAVIGITAGAATALSLVPRTRGQRWYVATDPDGAGRAYARKVAEALFPTPVQPFPMEAR